MLAKLRKLPIIYLLLFIVLISSLSCLVLSYIEDRARKNIQGSLNTVLQMTQEALQGWSLSQTDKVLSISQNPEVKRLTQAILLKQDDYQQRLSTIQLKTLLNQSTRYFSIQNFYLVDNKGFNLISKLNDEQGQRNSITQKRGPEISRILKGETLFIPPIMHSPHDDGFMNGEPHPVSFIGSPVIIEGQTVAILLFALDPILHFSRITELGRMGQSGETYAFDRDGLLLTQSRFTKELQTVGVIEDDHLAMLSLKITDPKANLIQGDGYAISEASRELTLMAQRAIKGDCQPYYDAYRDYRGVPVFGAWLWNKTLGIGLATEIDVAEAMHNYFIIRYATLFVLMLITFLTLFVALLPMRFHAKEKQLVEKHKRSLVTTVKARTKALEKSNYKLKQLSEIDPLTCLSNRRAYNRVLMKEVKMAKRSLEPISLIMIDIDYFKLFNDNYGHEQGDVTIQLVSQKIKQSLSRKTDFAARYGGEEFVVILPATNEKGALEVAERIRKNIELSAIEHEYSLKSNIVTVSLGCVTLEGNNVKEKALFQKADHALYLAKKAGRNLVINYTCAKGVSNKTYT